MRKKTNARKVAGCNVDALVNLVRRSRRAEGIGLAYRIVIAQLVAALGAALALSVVSMGQATAAALGGLVCILPTAGFAVCASRLRNPGPILAAGALKPLAVVGLMAAAFILANPAPLGFFVGLGAVHLAYLAVPLLDRERARAKLGV